MDNRAVGGRIRKAREERGLTQEQLGALTNLSPQHISVIERGIKNIQLENFVKIANALEVPADLLLQDVCICSSDSVLSDLFGEHSHLSSAGKKKLIRIAHILEEE